MARSSSAENSAAEVQLQEANSWKDAQDGDLEEEIVFEKRRIQLYAIYNNIGSSIQRAQTHIPNGTAHVASVGNPIAHIDSAIAHVTPGSSSSVIGEHRLFLEDWNRQFEASERNLERKQASCSGAKSDLYQILGLFFVFQGVVLTAIAQTNQLTCPNWYLPFLLSLIVFAAAFVASVQKLAEIAVLKEQFNIERALYLSLYKSIENLKERGTDLDLDKCQPELRGAYTKPDITGFGNLHNLYSSIGKFSSVWIVSYAGGVLFLLCTFSGITLFSVKEILCYPHASAPSPSL